MKISRANTCYEDATRAARELADVLGHPTSGSVVFFCSPRYDLDALGRALHDAFDVPLVGCTTAGQIGPSGFQAEGIVAASLDSGELRADSYLISGLADFEAQASSVAARINDTARGSGHERSFGFLLVDGLSRAEERLTSLLYQLTGDLPIVGGSAGDDLAFERTAVYHDGVFRSDAAVLTVFRNATRFVPVRYHHFEPTERRFVITSASPDSRVIHEIDGLPAIEAYGHAIGRDPKDIDAAAFSSNPLMLRVGDEHYVRSVREVSASGELSLFCGIARGAVVRLGRALEPAACARAAFAGVTESLGAPRLVLGCDCILRRLELERSGQLAEVGATFAENNVIGFSTYGEQFNSLHINQTFTGVALA